MLDVELQFDATSPIAHSDADGIIATSCTVTLYGPSGVAISSPTVTLPTLSTTLTTGTATALTLASVAGLARGDKIKITTGGIDYVAEVATVNATTKVVELAASLPVTPAPADVVKSLKMTATLAAPGASNVGGNCRLVWAYTDGTRARQISYAATVVRWQWVIPAGADDVREIVAELGGGSRKAAFCDDVLARVNDMIKAALLQTGRRPSLYLASGLFTDVARQGIRFELARRGICLGGQVYEAQRELRFAFDDALAKVVMGLSAYDSDGDGVVSAREATPLHYSIRATR